MMWMGGVDGWCGWVVWMGGVDGWCICCGVDELV